MSPIFTEREREQVLLSDLGLIAVAYAVRQAVLANGAAWVMCIYGVPVLAINAFFVLFTYLHHTHLSMPHYDSTESDWIKGALSTIDRDFGFLNRVFHHVTHTHVLHHLISYIPHIMQRRQGMPSNQSWVSIIRLTGHPSSKPCGERLWNAYISSQM
ncbi:Fatty acid desaturase, type 1 [Cynara cardunculus var. scolymus]|uniref:Fatty acid desaturase, type 1 n=1 Tax=Cynara cardunculus var. scolymus TaxID=59895 RepID=A0A118K7E0_CYNCS|nr:Fatty acid desaturase, type 1 [Cynara cardunculus var. scolymus]